MLAVLAMIRRFEAMSRLSPRGLEVEMAPEKALCEGLGMCCGFERRNRETKKRLAALKCLQPEPPNL